MGLFRKSVTLYRRIKGLIDMKNAQEIRWIQLSDLHMYDSTDVERQKRKLYEQFAERTDFVVVTGDLHQYGKNYDMAFVFLKELVLRFGIERTDVVIIPGNHDVSTTDKRKEVIKTIDDNIENNPDVYRKELNQLYLGFRKYKKFLKDFYENTTDGRWFLENNIYIWKDKLAILRINTALISDGDHYKPQIIDIYGLEKLENSKFPCVAIMHHDYYAISDIHKPYIKSRFRELGVSAVLSGHKHRFSKEVIEIENGESIPNFCCAKSSSQPGDLWSDVGIIEYRWKIGEDRVKVIPYMWDTLKKAFVPTAKFENPKNAIVNDEGQVTFQQSFQFKKSDSGIETLAYNREEEKGDGRVSVLEEFYETVQPIYLDSILAMIGDDDAKFEKAVEIMERIITYDGKKINFKQVVDSIVACKRKVVLSINGLQGTGKSTFLSLVYYEIKKKCNETNVFPILIDLHAFDNYNKKEAKQKLQEHLNIISQLIKGNKDKRFMLLFDGADDYVRKTSDLEDVLGAYVKANDSNNFAFCIGSADYLPNEMCKVSTLQTYSRMATYKLEAHRVKKSDDENISAILNNLIVIKGYSVNENDIARIRKAINIYTINKIDYRTLVIILRVFEINTKDNHDYQLGNYLYDYYLAEMNSNESDLYKHAEATYKYIILKKQDALRLLKYAKIIYNNGITIDFLLAYYFVSLIRNGDKNLSKVLNSDFVFTASVNKFIKDLMLNKYKRAQVNMVERLISAYGMSDMSMKSQIAYILGRIEENNAKEKAKVFLICEWGALYGKLFKEDKLVSEDLDIKSELVLFRTTSVSLIWLGYDKKQEQFLRCLLLNEKLNQINRGFHLEYYEDKAYMNGVSPTYVDDNDISVNKTMNYLISNINMGFSKSKKFNKSIYLDIVTLFSIYQYRMHDQKIKKEYESRLIELTEKILCSPEIQSKTVINYVAMMKERLSNNPYKDIIEEMYMFKSVKREGWIRRNVKGPESIADHMYGCYILGMFFLPNNAYQCIDYNIPDIENYLNYSKASILEMLLLHDLAEVKIGDIVAPEKVRKDLENENAFFDYYEFLCSFPHIYGLGNQKKVWDEFISNSTINAKIANDIDKIEPLIQAYVYKKNGNIIDLKEWEEYARKNVKTSLGKQFLHFIIEKILA